MTTSTANTVITVAMLGNPNTGKSTLFNALSGVRQKVGNYPGVTVEKKVGRVSIHGRRFDLVDLPGTYSLAPRSPDEMVTVDVLLGRQADVSPPDVVVCIVDASNLERNLYLVSQALELGRPIVLALNMIDVAADKGLTLDVDRLRRQLGLPVIPLQAHRKSGVAELKEAIAAAGGTAASQPQSPFPAAFQREVSALEEKINSNGHTPLPRYLVERLLLDTSGYLEGTLPASNGEIHAELVDARRRLADAGSPVPAVEAMARYQWVAKVLEGVVTRPKTRKITWTDRLDHLLTHKVAGSVIFVLLMALIFQLMFRTAEWPMNGIEGAIGVVGEAVAAAMPEGALRSLVVDGAIAGVGGVVVFLPQIMILFFFIAVLEDCGYMARAAYLMDKLMSRIGLSGKSFIPLLSSFACAIPGIMAARVIENRRDRLVTILIAPLMSCSARLPVYTLLIAAFIPETNYLQGWVTLQGLTMLGMYAVGVVTAIVVALVLKRTLLAGATPPFVLELPSYKFPSLRTVLLRVFDRGWAFVRRAGTLIFAVSIVVWAAAYFPHDEERIEGPYRFRLEEIESQIASILTANGNAPVEQLPAVEKSRLEELEEEQAQIDNTIAGLHLRNSYLGRAGHFIEPAVRPLGWDWRIGCAAIASFPAREIVIGTLGVIFNLGSDVDEESSTLKDSLASATWSQSDPPRPLFNTPVALSIMVFFALCAQCAATLAVIRRETNHWGWPVFTFVYMTGLAWIAAFITYQVGIRL